MASFLSIRNKQKDIEDIDGFNTEIRLFGGNSLDNFVLLLNHALFKNLFLAAILLH